MKNTHLHYANKARIMRTVAAAVLALAVLCLSGCGLSIDMAWKIPNFYPAAQVAAPQPETPSEAPTAATTTAPATAPTQPSAAVPNTDATEPTAQTEPSTAPAPVDPNSPEGIYRKAVSISAIQDVVVGSKFSSLTVDFGDKETFDALGNVHDFSKEHEFTNEITELPDITGCTLQMTDNGDSYTISCEAGAGSADGITADIPIRQASGYVYFLDIAAADGILSLLGSEKADDSIYADMGDGKVSMRNGTYTCEIDKTTGKLTGAKLVFEETFDDIVSLSFPKPFSADLTMNISLTYSFGTPQAQ